MLQRLFNLLDKWSCKHDWHLECKAKIRGDFGTRVKILTYICKNCGAFKRWKAN